MATSEDLGKVSPLPKACENCRIRKIRCNRVIPCSNCLSSGIDCKPATKQAEHRPRLVVSNHYEKQIERIHERLLGIESALKSVSISQSSSTPQSHSSQTKTQRPPTNAFDQFEGDSSFHHQSAHATEIAQSLNITNDGTLSNAIDSLKDVLNSRELSFVSTSDIHFTPIEERGGGPQMELLPAEFVLRLLAKSKEKYPVCFYNYSLPNDSSLDRLCQRAYFPLEPMSLGETTSMYGLLWFIIQEYMNFEDPIINDFDFPTYMEICERNFHAGIETYDLLAEPTFDNAFALMLAASKAQDEGKVILCWSLSSSAARHVQALGYHRELALRKDNLAVAERKRHLFWSIYGIEKNMSLNLGRASSFQDWDIDVKMFSISSDPAIVPWNIGTITFIELSRVQGQMYEKLYSASAVGKSHAERSKAIEELAQDIDRIYAQSRKVDVNAAAYAEFYQMFFEACDVIYYTLMTILHRAAFSSGSSSSFSSNNGTPGTEITSKCFEAAKMSLKSHLLYFPLFTKQGDGVTIGYVNYVLLYCSFTPFIVVFLHAIASVSAEDVKLLQDMTSSLEPVKHVSAVLNRLYEVCSVFSKVAEVIVASSQGKSQRTMMLSKADNDDGSYVTGVGSGFDGGLTGPAASLGTYDHHTDSLFFPGFMPHHGFEQQQLPDIFMQGDILDPSGSNLNDMSAYFGNWVSSNQPAMDLFSIDFGRGQ